MIGIKHSNRVLLAALLLAFVIAGMGSVPGFASDLQVYTGKITLVKGDVITLDNYKKFEPATPRAEVPKWAENGTIVKVGYYSQQLKNYYYEIGEPGKRLEAEERRAAKTRGDY